jgi:hypothetical protein
MENTNAITLNVAGMSGTYREHYERPASYREAVRLARRINAEGYDVQILINGRVVTDTATHGATAGTYKPVHVVTYLDTSDSLYPRSLAVVNRTERTARQSARGHLYTITRAAAAKEIRAARARGAKLDIGEWIMDGYCITFGAPFFRRLGREATVEARGGLVPAVAINRDERMHPEPVGRRGPQ